MIAAPSGEMPFRLSSAFVSFETDHPVLLSRSREWATLTRTEREYCAAGFPRVERFAGRVAARRAIHHLLSCGGKRAVAAPGVEDVEIRRGTGGRPLVELRGSAAATARANGVAPGTIGVSISHRAGAAFAVAAAPSSRLVVGVDLLDQRTVRRLGERTMLRLADRVLTPEERRGTWFRSSPDGCLLASITAKEAVGKVLKRRHRTISWADVTLEIVNPSAVPANAWQAASDVAAAVFAGSSRFELGLARATTASLTETIPIAWAHDARWVYAVAMRFGSQTSRGSAS